MRFHDRRQAGQLLAGPLSNYADQPGVLVLALPRGGVPVAFEIAEALRVPLDICVVRKLGVPGHRELAMGAIAAGGVLLLNDDVVRELRISRRVIDDVAGVEREELERRERLYRGGRPVPGVSGLTVILVDDGLATGASMLAAVRAQRRRGARRIVVAVPVAAPDAYAPLRAEADDCIILSEPLDFRAVGQWYEDFTEIGDVEVCDLLARARGAEAPRTRPTGM
ncbi:phosphoribosyltransferase [bacterium]|nr:MAG: phosphoribosyltransferase [bacterium]